MRYFNGQKRGKNYFEGWYFKNNSDNLSISFIPSISNINNHEKKCYIQVITDTFSHTFEFPISDFSAEKNTLSIKINNNTFNESGINLNLEDDHYQILAELKFGPFLKLRNHIMGIFSLIPFMECNHNIISMRHVVNGKITINDKVYHLDKSLGYIESDYGNSFPTNYIWLQCNSFLQDVSLFLSKATIPFLGFKFEGHICSIIYNNKEYRFATYNFSKITIINKNLIILKRGKYILELSHIDKTNLQLAAPVNGIMKRKIHECINGNIDIVLKTRTKIIFKGSIAHAGIEVSNLDK